MDEAVTIVSPIRNEAPNIGPLIRRLRAVTRARVIMVDDSDDNTPQAIAAANADYGGVTLIHRLPGQRVGRLSGAVVCGILEATTPWVLVMDADLQHPPEYASRLIEAAVATDADFVIASRYMPGGLDRGLSPLRQVVSKASTWLAKAAFPRRLRGVTDPMSGFFVVRRELVDPTVLEPMGFKILLELLTRLWRPGLVVSEVPFVFAERQEGVSKGTIAEGLTYLKQLATLRRSCRWRGASLAPLHQPTHASNKTTPEGIANA